MMEVVKRITEKFDKDGNVVERITEEMADPTDRIQTQPIYVPYQPYTPIYPANPFPWPLYPQQPWITWSDHATSSQTSDQLLAGCVVYEVM